MTKRRARVIAMRRCWRGIFSRRRSITFRVEMRSCWSTWSSWRFLKARVDDYCPRSTRPLRLKTWIQNCGICVLVPVYVVQYGPGNFLWFSDIALLATAAALWLESSLLASMMALAVIILETVWIVDFAIGLIAGHPVIGLSAYMFDSKISLPIRSLTLFHIFLPVTLVWLLYRFGYDT